MAPFVASNNGLAALLPHSGLGRLLVGMLAVVLAITIVAQMIGPDCNSGTTDEYSPDLKQSQIDYLDQQFPEDFENRVRADEALLQMVHFTDPTSSRKPGVFLDVGAHLGRFSMNVFCEWGRQKYRDSLARYEHLNATLSDDERRSLSVDQADPQVHAFDLSEKNVLRLKLLATTLPSGALRPSRMAIGADESDADLAVYESAGKPSLSPGERGKAIGKVPQTTIDSYVSENSISKVSFMKIDAGGREALVLDGMRRSMKSGIIKQFIFEYSHQWKKEYTGLNESFSLRGVTDRLERQSHFDCYIIAKHRLLKVNGEFWDDRFELYDHFKYVNVDVWCCKHDFNPRRRIINMYNHQYQIDDYFDK